VDWRLAGGAEGGRLALLTVGCAHKRGGTREPVSGSLVGAAGPGSQRHAFVYQWRVTKSGPAA